METEHGITCECGETFQTTDALERHIEDIVVIGQVLDEIKRIGGEKFYRVAQCFEQDTHAGDIRELAATEDIPLTEENAMELAKQELTHLINRYDEYESTFQHVMDHRGDA